MSELTASCRLHVRMGHADEFSQNFIISLYVRLHIKSCTYRVVHLCTTAFLAKLHMSKARLPKSLIQIFSLWAHRLCTTPLDWLNRQWPVTSAITVGYVG